MGLGKRFGIVVLGGSLLIGGFGSGVVNNVGSGDRVFGVNEASALAFEDLYPRDAIAEREAKIKNSEARVRELDGRIKELRERKVVEGRRLKEAQAQTKADYKEYREVELREKKLGKRGNAKKVVEARIVYDSSKRAEDKIRENIKVMDRSIAVHKTSRNAELKKIYQWKKEIAAIKKKNKIK